MTYTLIHTIHIFSVFIYGGFLFVAILFLSKMKQSLNEEEHRIAHVAWFSGSKSKTFWYQSMGV
ncbi:hypothetical protein JHD48_01930 [Sulfurimonas sp. SAG-AH-194-I05]|nr:hypothetical protein [Sulfurimonas sp. SAG-AH-194-I05]MDF1874488.1 hypothetical protein [Sulfurimonas sp. SAG-AH-194-I05]